MNVIARLEYELAYYDSAVHRFNHYTTRTPPCRLFNAKFILLEEQLWYYLTHSWKDKGVHTFPKGTCPKVNVIARLEYELAYYDSAVHRFNHYSTRTPPPPTQVPMDKYGETQGRYIWWSSNKRIHEGPNVWWTTEQSWTVCVAVTEVSSYKLPGKSQECGIQEGNWRATEKFLLTWSTNVS